MSGGRFAHLPAGSREMIGLLGDLMIATMNVHGWKQASGYAHLVGEVIAGWRETKVARGLCEWSNDEDVELQTWAHRGWELIEQCPAAVPVDSDETDKIIGDATSFAIECSNAMNRRKRREMQRADDEHDAWERRMTLPYYFGTEG